MHQSPFFSHLQCRECGRKYAKDAIHVCEFDFGPLEAAYDYEVIAKQISRDKISARPRSMWRYWGLLPIEGEATGGQHTGFSALIPAPPLAAQLGVRGLFIKEDAGN